MTRNIDNERFPGMRQSTAKIMRNARQERRAREPLSFLYPSDYETRRRIRACLSQHRVEYVNAGSYFGAIAPAIARSTYTNDGMLVHRPEQAANTTRGTRTYLWWYGQTEQETATSLAFVCMLSRDQPFVLLCTHDFVSKWRLQDVIKRDPLPQTQGEALS